MLNFALQMKTNYWKGIASWQLVVKRYISIQWICYERSFSEFYLSIWNQLVVNQRLQLFVQSPQYLIIIPCKPVWVVPLSVSRTWGCLSPASLNSLSTQRSCRGFAIRGFVWCSPGKVKCGDNVCCCKANLSLENTHQIKLIVRDMND